MSNQRLIPVAFFLHGEGGDFTDTPEKRLLLEVLLRAIEDALFPCNRQHRVSAINWFKQVAHEPPLSFEQVCSALELSSSITSKILVEVLAHDKPKTKRKSWRTRAG